MKKMLFAALSVSTLIACSDDGGGTPVPFAELPAKLAAAQCAQIFRCCDSAEVMMRFAGTSPPVTNEAECTTLFTSLFSSFLTMEPITAGRQTYSESAAGSCIAAFEARACTDQGDAAPAACEQVFVGQVAAGGMCKDSQDCSAANSYCDGATATVFGTCKAQVAVGGNCTNDECVENSYCDFSAAPVCVALKANGATCDQDFECQSDNCNASNQCAAEPLTCDGV
jgi:hypothetical protein